MRLIVYACSFPVQSSRGIAVKHTTGVFRNSTVGPRAGTADPACAEAMTPQCLQALYNIPTDPATEKSSTMVVSSFVDSFASTTDLSSFLSEFRTDMSSDTSFDLTTLDGGQNDETKPSTEGVGDLEQSHIALISRHSRTQSLDIQYTVGIATEVPITFASVGSNNGGDLTGFLDLVNELISQDNPPTVFTTSFGFPEELVPEDLANNICNAYAQLGARGTSIFFSSGDSGVDDGQGGVCTTFRPTFPSGCPFVTVVGATQGVSPEVAADFSSGGFSNFFTQPDYQQDAVGSYLSKLGDTNAGLFNAGGRGFPDLSAAGVAYQVNIGGEVQPVSGTSASTPLFASMVALLNDRLAAQGQAPMGFLNPMLYSSGLTALDDVVQGSNPGCGTKGFPADQGWDPVCTNGSQ